jgi:hypothetical protein
VRPPSPFRARPPSPYCAVPSGCGAVPSVIGARRDPSPVGNPVGNPVGSLVGRGAREFDECALCERWLPLASLIACRLPP